MTMPAPLTESVTAALNAAPTLQYQPGVAVGVAQASQTPDQASTLGQVAGHASQVNAFADAVQATKHHSSFLSHVFSIGGDVLHTVENNPVTGDAGKFVLNAMSKPLQEVQHEYRYLHAVYVHEGVWQGLLHTVPVVAGGVIGGLAGGGYGAVLGAELAGSLEGHLDQAAWRNNSLWTKTADGGVYANNVSFGRDVASLLQHVPVAGNYVHGETYSVISGLADGVADWSADPLMGVGNAAKKVRELSYALKSEKIETMAADNAPRALGNLAANQSRYAPVNAARQSLTQYAQKIAPVGSPVWRAIEDQAKDSSASSILSKYRGISYDMAADLAQAKNTDQVLKVWQTHAAMEDHLSTKLLPTLTMTSLGAAKARAAFLTKWHDASTTDIAMDPTTGLPNIDFAKNAKGQADVTASWRDRLTAYRAYVVNDKGAIDAHEVDPEHNNFLKVIRDQALITQNRVVANKIADYAGHLDTPGRLAVYRQVVKNNVLSMIPDDTDLQAQMLGEIEKHLTVGSEGLSAGEFGRDIDGERVDTTQTMAGKVRAAVWSTQTGKVRIPNYMALVDAARSTGAISRFYGPLDSMAYRTLTSAFFKPLALLTPAFAIRVSLSEALLNAFRDGPRQYLGGQFAQRAATLREKLGDQDFGIYNSVGKVAQNAGQWLGIPHTALTQQDLQLVAHNVMLAKADLYDKISRGLATKDAAGSTTWTDTAARLAAENGQRMIPDGISAHEGASLEAERDLPAGMQTGFLKMAANKPKTRTMLGDDWGILGPGAPNHDTVWAGALNLRSRAPEARAAAQHIQEALALHGGDFDAVEHAATVQQAQWLMTPAGAKAIGKKNMLLAKGSKMDLATRQIRDLMAKTFSPETRTPHTELLDKMADGGRFDVQDVKDIHEDHRPLYVEGADSVANPTSTYSRLINSGFDKLVSPIIDGLSRKGIYVTKVDAQYRLLKENAAHLEATTGVKLADDELWDRAKIRAVEDMLPDIHNVYLRSQFSDLSRNLMPFYFAQEQAIKRWGRAAMSNPATVRRIQLLHHAGKATGVLQTDPTTGQESFVYPVDGLANEVLKKLAPLGVNGSGAIPIQFRGSMESLNSIVPGQETFSLRPAGPVVAIPALALQKMVPDSTPAVQALLQQSADGGFWQQAVPNTFLRNMVKAYAGDNSQSYLNAQFDAMRAMKYHGLMPSDEELANNPQAKQYFLTQAKNWTRIALILNAVTSSTGLAATRVQAGDTKITDAFRKQMQESPDIRQAFIDFMKKHPDATPYTVFNSDSETGATLPAGTAALKFLNDNPSLFAKYPHAASWLFPQVKGDQFSQSAYNEQAAFGIRQHKNAGQLFDDLYSASADQEYYNNYDRYQQALTQAGGNPNETSDINRQWRAWVQDFGNFHPIWYKNYNDPARVANAQTAAEQLGVVLGFLPGTDGKVAVRANSPQVQPMRSLYGQYMTYARQLAALQAQGASTSDLKSQWKAYLDGVAKSTPELQPVISRVFKVVASDTGVLNG